MASRSFDNEKPTLEATKDDPSKKKRKREISLERLEEQERILDEQKKYYKKAMREIKIAYVQSYRLLQDYINNNVPNVPR